MRKKTPNKNRTGADQGEKREKREKRLSGFLKERKWFRRIGNVLLELAVVFCVILLVAWSMGIRPYIVTSGSMEPAMLTGSLCFVDTNVSYGDIQTGDIIAFRQGNHMVTHRVVTVTSQGIETKGDANESSDGITTTPDTFVGKTRGSIPCLGYLLHILQRPPVFLCLLIWGIVWIFAGRQSEEGIVSSDFNGEYVQTRERE